MKRSKEETISMKIKGGTERKGKTEELMFKCQRKKDKVRLRRNTGQTHVVEKDHPDMNVEERPVRYKWWRMAVHTRMVEKYW